MCHPIFMTSDLSSSRRTRMVVPSVGVEASGGTFRVSAGPVVIHGDTSESVHLGGSTRLDFAVGKRLAVVNSGRATLLPGYNGDTMALFGATVGLRLR